MKPITPAILALLLAGSAGLSGLVPAYADDPAPTPPPAAAAPAPSATTPDVPPPAVNPDTHAPQDNGATNNGATDNGVPDNGAADNGGGAPASPPNDLTPPDNAAPGGHNWAPQGGSAGGNRFGFGGPRAGFGGGFGGGLGGGLGTSVLRLGCGDRGAEALEIAFVRIQYEVKPTGAQQPLFNTLKQAALADQKNYADACQAAMASIRGQAQGPGQQSSVLDRFAARLAVETARVNALNDILPKFRAFFDSLSDQQKAQFQPRRAMFPGNGMGNMGPGDMGRMGPGHMGPGGMAPGNMHPNMGPGGMGPNGMGHGNMGHGNMRPNGQGGSMPPSGLQRLRPMPGAGQPDDGQPDNGSQDNGAQDNGPQGVPVDPAANDSTPA